MVAHASTFVPKRTLIERVEEATAEVVARRSEEREQAGHVKTLLRRLHYLWRVEDEVGFYRTLKEAESRVDRWERRWSDPRGAA